MKIKLLILLALVITVLSSCNVNKEHITSSTKIDVSSSKTIETSTEPQVVPSSNISSTVTPLESIVSSKKSITSSKHTVTSKSASISSKKQNTSSKKPSSSKKTNTKKVSSTIKKDWISAKGLTFTKADIGKVVGYSSMLDQDLTIVDIKEGYNGLACKYIYLVLSDSTVPNEFCLVECLYCHEMPCPKGGGEKCDAYSVKADPAKTCIKCERPLGDGHNGTCHSTIDWDNGGKTTCHNYD